MKRFYIKAKSLFTRRKKVAYLDLTTTRNPQTKIIKGNRSLHLRKTMSFGGKLKTCPR
jgi:hypothetical protein